MVCHGRGCEVTFRNVTFEACTLVVTERACASLQGTTSSFDPKLPHGVAVFATGPGTKLSMHRGCITGGTQGVTVQVCGLWRLCAVCTVCAGLVSSSAELFSACICNSVACFACMYVCA